MFMPYKTEGDIILYINYMFYTLIRFFFTLYEWILLTKLKIRETTEKAIEKLISEDPEKYGALWAKSELIID